MSSSGMLRRVAFIRTEVSGQNIASLIRVTRIGELEITLAVTINRSTLVFLSSLVRLLVTANVVPSSQILVTLMKEEIRSSEYLVLTRAIHFSQSELESRKSQKDFTRISLKSLPLIIEAYRSV
jgi:hypothetical protein